MNKFAYLENISSGKENIRLSSGFDPNMYMLMIGLSNYPDTILYANEANKLDVSDEMKYDFLFHSVHKRKRYGSWAKSENDMKAIEAIQNYFGYSYQKAKEAMSILSAEQILEIQKKMELNTMIT